MRTSNSALVEIAWNNASWGLLLGCAALLAGCSPGAQGNPRDPTSATAPSSVPASNSATASKAEPPVPLAPCLGDTSALAETVVVDDPFLAQQAQGAPGAGKICRAVALRTTTDRVIYRAYNSTNPGSRLGQWWALDEPSGAIAAYREAYQICYQWSPLDKLVRCTLPAGAVIVAGGGQSVTCSEHLRYSVSPALQIYLPNPTEQAVGCTTHTGVFAWKPDEEAPTPESQLASP